MSKIRKIKISNYLGISEFEMEPGKINYIKGPKGSSKTSILEAIEKAYTNNDRRPVVIKDNGEEATIFIEQDDNMSIDRRIRKDKTDYLKLKQDGIAVKSTESELRKFLNGDIFRPIDWINRDIKDQTESILNMLEIDWNKSDIESWFGEIPKGVNYDKHILQVLKDIEKYYYDIRVDVNREIRNKKAQIDEDKAGLPDGYNGEDWRKINLSELYNDLNKAIEFNNDLDKKIEKLNTIQDSINTVELQYRNLIDNKNNEYDEEIKSTESVIQLDKEELINLNNSLNNLGSLQESELKDVDLWLEKEIQMIKDEAQIKKDGIKQRIQNDERQFNSDITSKKLMIDKRKSKIDNIDKTKILALETLENQKKEDVEKIVSEKHLIEKFVSNNSKIDVDVLKSKADDAELMKGYLREYDKINELKTLGKEKQTESNQFTSKINISRELPQRLIQKVNMPIDGISVNDNGEVEINDLPLANLSDGEKFDLAMQIAKCQAGELKLICLDRFESLNPSGKERFLECIKNDEFQYFITDTQSDEYIIQKDEEISIRENNVLQNSTDEFEKIGG